MTPLQRLEKHIRQVSRGDLAQPPLKSRGKEDFGELYESYNYLYRSLQAHTEAEIKKMETLTLDPQHREAYFNWKRLIETKQNQLGIKKAS